jgi:cytoskeleton protein RodZ
VTSAPVSSAPKASNVSSRASLSSSTAQSVSSVIASEPKHNPDEITFSFSGESWLEVSDARGDVLATEMQLAGSHLTLVGQAPFDIKLGNAPVVEIQFNRKKIDVIPLLGSNVLTLQVGN